MPVGVAAIDANLLVPIIACDFLLTAFDHGLFEPVVSITVLDEVERTLLEDFPQAADADQRRVRAGCYVDAGQVGYPVSRQDRLAGHRTRSSRPPSVATSAPACSTGSGNETASVRTRR